MDDYISISTLNDFVFCPYSIYLHNIYMNMDEGLYQATPQVKGKISHTTIDNKTYHKSNCITSLSVCSNEYKLKGKIDIYNKPTRTLIERKYRLKNIYKGQIYQLWAQYLCMNEMGYEIEKLAFHEIETNTIYNINLPTKEELDEFRNFIESYITYNPLNKININTNKCKHCIYCNLCDKIDFENVY